MTALGVMEHEERIRVDPGFLDRFVPLLASLDAEMLVEQRAVHALAGTVCPRRADFVVGCSMSFKASSG